MPVMPANSNSNSLPSRATEISATLTSDVGSQPTSLIPIREDNGTEQEDCIGFCPSRDGLSQQPP